MQKIVIHSKIYVCIYYYMYGGITYYGKLANHASCSLKSRLLVMKSKRHRCDSKCQQENIRLFLRTQEKRAFVKIFFSTYIRIYICKIVTEPLYCLSLSLKLCCDKYNREQRSLFLGLKRKAPLREGVQA